MADEPRAEPARAPRVGRALVWLGWTLWAGALVAGIVIFGKAYHRSGVNVPMMLTVLASWGIAYLLFWGYRLAGRARDSWEPLRWPLRTIASRLGVSLVFAASVHYLEHAVDLAYRWIPTRGYRALHGILPTGAAVAASIPVWIAWTIVVLIAATVVKEPLKALAGRGTATAEWIDETFGGVTYTEGGQAPETPA